MTGTAPAVLTSDQVVGFVLLDLVLIIVAARAMGLVAQRVGQPKVVGEIVAGVLLGPTLLGASVFTWHEVPSRLHCDRALTGLDVEPSISGCLFPPQARSILGPIGQIALLFYMLLVGMELDLSTFRRRARSIACIAVGSVAVPVLLGFALTPLLFEERFANLDLEPSRVAFALLIGGMLAVTAFPVMARVLQEKSLIHSPMGSAGVAAASAVSVLMFLVLAVGGSVARDEPASSMALRVAGVVLYLTAMICVARPLLASTLGSSFARRGTLTGDMLAMILGVGAASAYVAHALGINVIVGAFVAGAVMPSPREELFHAVWQRLGEVTTAVLLPVFLAFSGLSTDFTQLRPGHVAGLLAFLGAGVIGKWGATALAARASGMSWREGNVLGVLMNCRGLLVLVAALVARDTGVITGPMQVGAALMALVTTAMTGPLLDVMLRAPDRTQPEIEPAAPPAGLAAT